MDCLPSSIYRAIPKACQNSNHINQNNEGSLEFYFIHPQKNQQIHQSSIICNNCISKQDQVCCKVEDVQVQLSKILNENYWDQVLVNSLFSSKIQGTINSTMKKEQLVDEILVDYKLKDNQQKSTIMGNLHIALNHGNKQKLIESFQEPFQILKEKVNQCFFNIFDQPQLKVQFQYKFTNFILIKEKNVFIGKYQRKVLIYNYKNQNQIMFNAEDQHQSYNNDYVVYYNLKNERYLKIIDLSTLQRKVLMRVDQFVSELQIINHQLWIKFYNQRGIFVNELSFNELNQKNQSRIMLNRINLKQRVTIIEDYFIQDPRNKKQERTNIQNIIYIRNFKTCFTLPYEIGKLIGYDKQKKIGIFEIQYGNHGKKIVLFNLICRRQIRKFYIPNTKLYVYHNKYLAYFYKSFLMIKSILDINYVCCLDLHQHKINSRQIDNNFILFRQKNLYSFWFDN